MFLADVTLREGAQMPDRSYSVPQKIKAGRLLAELGVPIIQAGFPIIGERHSEPIRRLAEETDAEISALARPISGDIDAALEANADVIEIFAPLGDRQLDVVLGKPRSDVLEKIETAIGQARAGGATVHLSFMDAFRTAPRHIIRACRRFQTPEVIGLADTVGSCTPSDVRAFLNKLESADVALTELGVHFHDDFGLATANTMTAAEAGVQKADVSVGALGERAGNTALEEIVVAAACSDAVWDSGEIRTSQVIPTCKAILETFGEPTAERKPILGDGVTRHEAGLHTAAMLEDPSIFEPFDPSKFGGERNLIFGEGSGRGAARNLLKRANVEPTENVIENLLAELSEQGPVDLEEAIKIATQLSD